MLYVAELCKLYTEELHCVIIDSLTELLKSHIRHFERSLQAQIFAKEVGQGHINLYEYYCCIGGEILDENLSINVFWHPAARISY